MFFLNWNIPKYAKIKTNVRSRRVMKIVDQINWDLDRIFHGGSKSHQFLKHENKCAVSFLKKLYDELNIEINERQEL